ncbi:MAG: BON domain-containing protein [Planctomycetota bacterium]|nr:BON domain-containing protein [Planctomycetota bacterium]
MQRIENPNSVGPESLSSVAPVALGASVVAEVQRELRESPYLSMRRITCDYHEGVLTLRGNAPTYYVKQLAQTIALRTKGVDEVANRINVASPND